MADAFQTLSNGTLLDYALDEGTGYLSIRAGKGWRPTSRPEILQLTPVEVLVMANTLLAMYAAVRQSAILASARKSHAEGATHDCGEWAKDGQCQICERQL